MDAASFSRLTHGDLLAGNDIRIMPTGEDKKGAIPQLFEESLPVLGIIQNPAKYPNERNDVWLGFPTMM